MFQDLRGGLQSHDPVWAMVHLFGPRISCFIGHGYFGQGVGGFRRIFKDDRDCWAVGKIYKGKTWFLTNHMDFDF